MNKKWMSLLLALSCLLPACQSRTANEQAWQTQLQQSAKQMEDYERQQRNEIKHFERQLATTERQFKEADVLLERQRVLFQKYEEQNARFDKLLERWETQTKRADSILEKLAPPAKE